MTSKELRHILSELRSLPGETEVVEFKEAKENFDFHKLGKYFSALSNEANLKSRQAGWLIFGIENKRRNIIGSNYRAGNRPSLDKLKSEIANKTTNRISFIEIHELPEPQGRVVLFQIPPAPRGIPVAWEGHYYGRDGEELAPLNLEKIDRIRRQMVSVDWSAEVCPDATIRDLDREKIDDFIARAQVKRGFPLATGTSIKKVLTHLDLLRGDKLCIAAILAFGKKPQQYFTTAITKCAHFHGFVVEKPIPDHKVFHGDVFSQVDAAVDFVMSKISSSVGMRTESNDAPIQYEIPRAMVAEAIVNAIVHRDYASNGSVQIMLFADRLGIWNPGSLTPALNIRQLKIEHSSYPTNPKLAELMYQAGYIEKYGTGTGEIFKLARKAGLREPGFDLAGEFRMTIWRPKAEQEPVDKRTSTAPVPHQYRTSTAPVSHQSKATSEVQTLIATLDGEMNRTQIQKRIGLKHKATFLKNYIQSALAAGFIELTIPDKPNSPKQSYRLTEKGMELKDVLGTTKR